MRPGGPASLLGAHEDLARQHLADLARAHGVATFYESLSGEQVQTGERGIRAALTALGVPAGDDEAVRASLAEVDERHWRRLIAPTVVTRQPDQWGVPMHLPDGPQPHAVLITEDARESAERGSHPGGIKESAERGSHPGGMKERVLDDWYATDEVREVGGQRLRRWWLTLPANLPTGDHRLVIDCDARASATVVVTPHTCPLPERGWGWGVQLYATRSARSWGMGDFGDLRELARWGGECGADFLLLNPLHATSPGVPQEASPYSPTSRRFTNPLYLAIEDVPELSALHADHAARVSELAAAARSLNVADRIDRDAVYLAKIEALELLHTAPLAPERVSAFAQYQDEQGQALTDFATYCALAERHGSAWRSWPAELRRPGSPAVESARSELGARVAFHVWLQWLTHEQLARAQTACARAGMRIGMLADLAVGAGPDGADAWALQDYLGLGVTVGAPPDDFNPLGQDWALPPLLPNRLIASAYAPFRQAVRASLRYAGGLRVDHILGLFRQWWVPQGAHPREGTYVQYPAEDLLNVLALEAHRAGAVVVGEDLGVVSPRVRDLMWDRGMLGSRVVYFEHTWPGAEARPAEMAGRSRPHEYAERALTSVTTHDLATAAGFWTGEAIETQIALGLLEEGVGEDDARRAVAQARASLLAVLREQGLATDETDVDELVHALQVLAARTASLLAAVALGDAVADRRQPNVPGTIDEYPNWRLPLFDGQPLPLERLIADPRVLRLVKAINEARG